MEVHHVIQALESASEAFEQGCVGADGELSAVV